MLTLAAAVLGGLASADAREFYAALDLPAWAPPGGVFGPVWTLLYIGMAVSACLYWKAAGWPAARRGMLLFVLQLAANALWSWLFFAWHLGAWAFADVVLLWCLIVANCWVFFRVHRLAGWLLVPYLAWVSFAAALTWAVWQRNPALLG